MLDIVIVEDEMLVRMGIKMCIEKHRQHFNVKECFATGEEANIYFQDNTCDILLCDIELPGMTGLELIRNTLQVHSEICCIVLSCYDTFQYVRESYELGAEKYILKQEIDETQIKKLLLNTYNDFYKDKLNENHIFKKVIKKINEVYILAKIIFIDNDDNKSIGNEKISLQMIANIIKELIVKSGLKVECYVHHDKEVLCLIHCNAELKYNEIKQIIDKIYCNSVQTLNTFFNQAMFWVLSSVFSDEQPIKDPVEEIYNAESYIFYKSSACLIWIPDENKLSNLELEESLVFINEDFLKGTYTQAVETFFTRCRKKNINPQQIRDNVFQFLFYIIGYLYSEYEDNRIKELESKLNIQENLFGRNNITQCKVLEEYVISAVDYMKRNIMQLTTLSPSIKAVVNYLHQNIHHDDLTLSFIANKFAFSSPYLSTLFKKQMGVNLISYINSLRILKACELLDTTDMSAEEISIKVGIKNTSYFFKLFKKITGKTIGKYKLQTAVKKPPLDKPR